MQAGEIGGGEGGVRATIQMTLNFKHGIIYCFANTLEVNILYLPQLVERIQLSVQYEMQIFCIYVANLAYTATDLLQLWRIRR